MNLSLIKNISFFQFIDGISYHHKYWLRTRDLRARNRRIEFNSIESTQIRLKQRQGVQLWRMDLKPAPLQKNTHPLSLCVSVCVYRWVRHDFYVSFFISLFFFQFFGRMFTSVPSFLLCHVKKKKKTLHFHKKW